MQEPKDAGGITLWDGRSGGKAAQRWDWASSRMSPRPGGGTTPFPEPSLCTQPRCERPGAPGAGPGRTAGPNPVIGGLARRFKGRSGSGKGCEERLGEEAAAAEQRDGPGQPGGTL